MNKLCFLGFTIKSATQKSILNVDLIKSFVDDLAQNKERTISVKQQGIKVTRDHKLKK